MLPTPLVNPGFVAAGLDLQASFRALLEGWGLSPALANVIWLPLPMLLVLTAAVVGVLVNVWLERKKIGRAHV